MQTQAKADCSNEAGAPSACGATSSPASLSNTSGTVQGAGNPINVITGNKYQEEVDMPALPGELGIEIVRHYNSSIHALGHMGYGWRLSYETDLYLVNNTIQIVEADGSRIIFARDSNNPILCATNNPANGQLHIEKTAKGEEYLWVWQNGRKLHFNHKGKLESITSSAGASVALLRGPKGELLRVTDPQGRSLDMEYASLKSKGFKGIVAIKSPVGRFIYTYENDAKQLGISNLLSVQYPDAQSTETLQSKSEFSQVARQYRYGESSHTAPIDPYVDDEIDASARAHLLTGITLTWKGAEGNSEQQRISTWAYDAKGRGILSIKGLDKVELRYIADKASTHSHQDSTTRHAHQHPSPASPIQTTILTNSLGQTTTYKHTLIAGEYRLLSVIGAGCSSCGESNVQYHYDAVARLTDVTKLDAKGQHLYTEHTERDTLGRTIKLTRIDYYNGKAQPAQLLQRFEYAQIQTTGKESETNYAKHLPVLIAKPSVVRGREHHWKIQYNVYGQPTQMTETGYRPALPTDKISEPKQIARSMTYTYQRINGKSLLAQQDGPLPNGKTNTPQDSDITQYHYDKQGRYLTKITAPNNNITKLEYDLKGLNHSDQGGAGRVISTIAHNGLATRFNYSQTGKVLSTQRYPATLSLVSAKEAGLLQSTAMQYDVFGKTTMIQRADGQTVYMQYGKDGKLTQLSDALGNRVEWKDWDKGQHKQDETVTTQQWFTADAPDTVASAWYFWHDDQQRLTQRLSPDGGLDTWRYSDSKTSDADQTLHTDATNDNHWVQHIDSLNRMTFNTVNNQVSAQIRMTPAGYLDASFTLNADLDNIKQTTGSTSQPTQIADDFGRVVLFRSAQHGTHIAQYNAANRITHIQQPDGTRINYSYDVAGRLLTKVAIAPESKTTNSVRYAYNAFGLTQIKDSTQTIIYQRDLLGRETDKATTLKLQNNQTTKPISKTYHIRTRYTTDGKVKAKQLIDGQWLDFSLEDKTGLIKAMQLHKTIWPSLTNKLAVWLNLPDLPLQIATTKTVVTDINVHPFNGITQLTHGNGISDDYGFDLAGRLTTVSHGKQTQSKKPNSPFIQASYTYDAGRRLISEQINTADFQGKVNAYAYTGWSDFSTPPKTGFIKAVVPNTATNSQASSATAAKIEYATMAQAGRISTDANYRYQYNVWGKLASVQNKTNNTTIARYQSNALGERVMASYPNTTNNQQANTNQTHYYLYDHQQRIAELDEQGNVLQQYLYVNQTPVAVINTPTEKSQQSDKQSPTGIIAIHIDRRHAPIAATDEQGKIIWQAEYDAWGKIIDASLSKEPTVRGELVEPHNGFNLSLRLPGQWQDQATGLYYNYQRDYNPDTGRYLTPDPLGFPDGADPYAYVNNDPLNKLDPLGLYQSDIHYYMTFFLAVAAGVPAEDARIIALATQYIDDNSLTQPLPHSIPQAGINILLQNDAVMNRLLSYHFTATPSDINAQGLAIPHLVYVQDGTGGHYVRDKASTNSAYVGIPENPQLIRLYDAVSLAKCNALGRNTELQFFGEYLHAFEDTFGHRDSNNVPIDANDGYGHFTYGHNPDFTYDHLAANPFSGHFNWNNNEARTLQMEQEVFAKMFQFATGKDVISAGKVTATEFQQLLMEFNATEENEESGYVKGDVNNKIAPSGAKIKLLQKTLDKWFGTGVIDITKFDNAAYNETEAANNRNNFLCVNGKPLDQKVYKGTILPTSCN
jgi:RHS repeat-associated protein